MIMNPGNGTGPFCPGRDCMESGFEGSACAATELKLRDATESIVTSIF